MVGRSGAGFSRAVGRRSRQRHACSANYIPGRRMLRHPDSNRLQSGCDLLRHPGAFAKHHGQGAGPESLGQLFRHGRHLLHQRRQILQRGDMHDERIVLGPAFGFKDFAHRLPAGSVGGQAINCFGGDGHNASPTEDLPRPLHIFLFICLQKQCFHHVLTPSAGPGSGFYSILPQK